METLLINHPSYVSCSLLQPSSLFRIIMTIMPSSYRPKLYDLCSFRYAIQEIKNDLMLCIGYDAGCWGWGGIELTILYARKRASHIVRCVLISVSKERVKVKLENQLCDRHRTRISRIESSSANHANIASSQNVLWRYLLYIFHNCSDLALRLPD